MKMTNTDKTLPGNAQANLDRKLDHAVEETFPTSDPVSVSVTRHGIGDGNQGSSPAQGGAERGLQSTAERFVEQASETIGNLAADPIGAAQHAYEEGRRFARAASDRYPDAERYYREGTQSARQQASENPILTLLVGIGLGYALGWLIHTDRSDRDQRVPDHARTGRGYAAHKYERD
jgi:hypothetical protein